MVECPEVTRRGAAIVALIDHLEAQGIRVELYGVSNQASHNRTQTMTHTIALKRAQDPLDLDRLAFCLAHPAMNRRLLFSAWETENAETRHAFGIPGHYARPIPIDSERGALTLQTIKPGEFETDQDAQYWIDDQISTAESLLTRAVS